MSLTATEEALVRQLLDQQAAILSLAGNEATITSKLGATKVTLSDLVAASALADTDLLLTRQGVNDKSVRADILASYMAAELELSQYLHRTGSIIFVASSGAPYGYLKANGALVSRTAYADLFAAIGTAFGVGDGSTTFALPDLRGEFIRGWDDGKGVDVGRVFGSSQTDSNRSHKHISPVNDTASNLNLQNARGTGWPSGAAAIGVPGCNSVSTNVIQETSGEDGWLYTGSDVYISGESRPRNIALLACIKF